MRRTIALAFLPWQLHGCVTQVRIQTSEVDEISVYLLDEFREPAKQLFNAGLARFTDQKIAGLAESWQHNRMCHRIPGLTRVDEVTSSMLTT